MAFQVAEVQVPSQAVIEARCAQASAAPAFLPGNAGGQRNRTVGRARAPPCAGPHFVGGGTPEEALCKIEPMVALVPADCLVGMRANLSSAGAVTRARGLGPVRSQGEPVAPSAMGGPKEDFAWHTRWQGATLLLLRHLRINA